MWAGSKFCKPYDKDQALEGKHVKFLMNILTFAKLGLCLTHLISEEFSLR